MNRSWELETEKEESKAVSIQMNKLQEILLPKAGIIRKLCEKIHWKQA